MLFSTKLFVARTDHEIPCSIPIQWARLPLTLGT
jgi:hypothetical protein